MSNVKSVEIVKTEYTREAHERLFGAPSVVRGSNLYIWLGNKGPGTKIALVLDVKGDVTEKTLIVTDDTTFFFAELGKFYEPKEAGHAA